jgi:tetratricopeptide (TPR) repeat protein
MARIFISHSSLDVKQAEDLKAWLGSIGFEQTFLDFDKHTGIPPGADWERTLYREIERAQAVILILTKNWFDSKWCFAEFTQTRARGKAIFALVEAPTGETSVVSSDIQHVNLVKDRKEGLERLAGELTRVALHAQGGFEWEANRPPYPGLLSFDAADAAIFFGRDDDVLRAIERINVRRVHGGAKLFAILGGSGSGKSSLLKAGILPRLARDKKNFLVVPPFRPGSDPILNLLGALQAIDLSLTRADLDAVVGPKQGRALIDRIRRAAGAPQATLIIAADQAEEAFTGQSQDTQDAFFDLLSRLLAGDNPALGILTLRSDHLPDLQTADKLSVRFEEFSLKPMPIERLGMIVEGPAEIVGLAIGEGLVSALMRDAKTHDALPLVAFVLRRLYDRRSHDVLTQAQYESMRDGLLSPLEVAVRDAAKEAMARVGPTQDDLNALRESFVPDLVRVNDEGAFVRRSASLERLPAPAHKMLRALADARLLVVDHGVVEVAHEALFRVWPLLSQWLEEEREFLIGKSRVEKSREDYAKLAENVRAKGLLSGILLERAKSWLAAHPKRFSEDEASFIRASIEDSERQERERAEQRERLRQAELSRARAEAERANAEADRAKAETERAETEAKRAQQQAEATKRFLRLAQAATVVFAALGSVALYFWVHADAAEKLAKSNFNLAIDQAASNVDTIVDNYQAGRISTSLLSSLVDRAQNTVDRLHSDTSEAAAAKARLLRAVSRAYIVLSRASLAEQKAREELEITNLFLARYPSDPDWMQLGERAHEELGQSLFWKGDLAGALQNLRAALATTQSLANEYPDNKDYEQDLIEIYRFTGDCLRNQAKIDEAQAQYQNWLDLANRLADKQPLEIAWLRDQMFARQRMGDVLMAKSKPAEAREHFATYLELAKKGQNKESDNKEFAEAVAIAHQRVGDSYFGQGDMDNAIKEYQAYLPLAVKLATADQSNFIWNQDLEVAHQRIGEVYLHQGRNDQALKEFNIYLAMARDTLDKDGENGAALFDVTNATEKVGDALRGQKNYDEALKQYQSMLSNALILKKMDVSNGIWSKALAVSYQRIGLTFEAQGDKLKALANFQGCAATPVPTVLWDLRDLWPPDVTGFCQQKVAALTAATPP